MNRPTTVTRMVFCLTAIAMAITYSMTLLPEAGIPTTLTLGLLCGIVFSALVIGLDISLKWLDLRSFNITILGLFTGYLFGQLVQYIYSDLLATAAIELSMGAKAVINGVITLTSLYIGISITRRAAEEISIHIPFAKLTPAKSKKKDILLDQSVLTDSRLIDLAASGMIDNHLVLPRYIVHLLYDESEHGDEHAKGRARRCLEVIKKLDQMAKLGLRYSDLDAPEAKDPLEKLVKLARMIDANILTLDISQIKLAEIEDISIIKLHALCNALKPLTQSGETLSIKIQRYGKEARQGVGYLDDGTMVVVNGGAEYIGEIVKAQVLSVKHTSSGRMIFCNAIDEGLDLSDQEYAAMHAGQSGGHEPSRQPNDYFAY